MQVRSVAVRYNREETPSVYRLGVSGAGIAEGVAPARFGMLALPAWQEHLLPRPFSYSDVVTSASGEPVVEFLYKPVGRVTRRFTRLVAGDGMLLGGPLGNGFPELQDGQRAVLLAGGIGNAPFALHVRHMIAAGVAPERIVLLLAGRGARDLWIQDDVRKSGCSVVEITEDGSRGEQGLVTDALLGRMADLLPCTLFACGPHPMLRAVQGLALEHGLACHLALEAHMACGYGVCNACVVARAPGAAVAGWLRLCVEGPVCEAREVVI